MSCDISDEEILVKHTLFKNPEIRDFDIQLVWCFCRGNFSYPLVSTRCLIFNLWFGRNKS